MAVFNTDKSYDYKKQKMFFGEDLGVSRFEDPKHPKFESLTEKHLAQYWRPEEIQLLLDSAQFHKLPTHEQEIFTNNLKYQIIMDRVQSDAPAEALSSICSDMGLQAWIQTWTFFETIHARSYTHIIRNLYANPSKVFDEIVFDEKLMERAASITEQYDRLIKAVHQYELIEKGEHSEEFVWNIHKELYLCMHTVNALEAIRFYASFITTFNFQESRGVMEGNVKIMKFIARDENLHHQGTRYIIEQWHSGKEGQIWLDIAKRYRQEATDIFNNVRREEKEWAVYNFRKGNPLGLNAKLLADFIDYVSIPQMNKLGLITDGLEAPKSHPLPWVNKYLISSNVQGAPQEVEIDSYLLNQVNSDITDDVMNNFKTRYGE